MNTIEILNREIKIISNRLLALCMTRKLRREYSSICGDLFVYVCPEALIQKDRVTLEHEPVLEYANQSLPNLVQTIETLSKAEIDLRKQIRNEQKVADKLANKISRRNRGE